MAFDCDFWGDEDWDEDEEVEEDRDSYLHIVDGKLIPIPEEEWDEWEPFDGILRGSGSKQEDST
jgi:hypothetical protein